MQLNSELIKFYIGDIKIINKMQNHPIEQPFSTARIDFLNELSKKLMSDKESNNYPDIITFAFWIRKSNMEKKKQEFISNFKLRMGRGIIFHIAPSNVAINYAYSFAVGFILGNANIVRLPSKEFPQIDIINKALLSVIHNGDVNKKWASYIVFLRYEKNREINDYLSSICDVRIIWGGDTAINEIRKSALPPRSGEITFADRYSICMIYADEYINSSHKEKIALDFYNDTYLSDQNACTSPKLVCWIGERKKINYAKSIFWNKLWDLVSKKYVFQPIQYVDKLTNGCLAAVAMDGIQIDKMIDNQIVRIKLNQIEPLLQEYWGNSGFFYEYDLKDIKELIPLCNEKLQTITYLGNYEKLLQLVNSGVKGIDRVVKIGKSMDFDFIWDGYDLKERLTREIYGF